LVASGKWREEEGTKRRGAENAEEEGKWWAEARRYKAKQHSERKEKGDFEIADLRFER